MDRYWFLTWRTYGTWLPGEAGFVGNYVSPDGRRVSDNAVGSPTTSPMPALARYAAGQLVRSPVYLTLPQATRLFDQFAETSSYRGRCLDAVAILSNHIHLVVATPGDPDPDDLLDDFKAYASRALNRLVGYKPPAPRPIWWAQGGSKRILKSDGHRAGVVRYVRDQELPLVVWVSDTGRELLAQYPDETWIGEPGASATG